MKKKRKKQPNDAWINSQLSISWNKALVACNRTVTVDVEYLANLEHKQWSGWMEYLFSLTEIGDNGSHIIKKEDVARWKRQMKTKYEDLPEHEKESDRIVARRIANNLDKILKEVEG